jgi:hypothetical protein
MPDPVVPEAVQRKRLTAQMLSGPKARDPLAVAERLLAVQGQDPRGARLAIRARSKGLSAADVDRALTADRSMLITWLNRGTLHLVRSEDYPWLQALTGHRLVSGVTRVLDRYDVSKEQQERGVKTIRRALDHEGPLIRAELRARLDSADVPTEGQALVHLLALASVRGYIVRGPMVGKQQAFVLVEDWLGPQVPQDRERALKELARRFMVGHGPADERDLARWSGLPMRDARAGIAAASASLHLRPDGLIEAKGAARAAPKPPPALLGAFDPLLLGWDSRYAIVGEHKGLITNNGLFRPFALVGGRAVALWTISSRKVELSPLRKLSASESEALGADADAVLRFLGLGGR